MIAFAVGIVLIALVLTGLAWGLLLSRPGRARKTAAPGAGAPERAPGAAPTDPDLTEITRWRADI